MIGRGLSRFGLGPERKLEESNNIQARGGEHGVSKAISTCASKAEPLKFARSAGRQYYPTG